MSDSRQLNSTHPVKSIYIVINSGPLPLICKKSIKQGYLTVPFYNTSLKNDYKRICLFILHAFSSQIFKLATLPYGVIQPTL